MASYKQFLGASESETSEASRIFSKKIKIIVGQYGQLRRREYFEWVIALVQKLTVGFDRSSLFLFFMRFFTVNMQNAAKKVIASG